MNDESLRGAVRDLAPARPPDGARERSWARQAVTQHAPPRSWGRFVVVAVVALGAIAAWLLAGRDSGRRPVPLRIAWADAAGSRPLASGARIDANRRDALVGDGESVLAWLTDGTRARVERLASRVTIRLASGEARVWSARRPQAEPLEVVTPSRRIRVVGTVFTVRTGPKGDAVWVGRGVVEVHGSNGLEARLSAGSRWASGEVSPAVLAPEGLRWFESRATAGGDALGDGWPRFTAPARAASPHPRASVPAGPIAARSGEDEARGDPGRRDGGPRIAPAPSARGRLPEEASIAPEAVEDDLLLPDDPEPAQGPDTGVAPPRATDLAREAMQLERSGQPSAALALYRRVAAGSGESAEFALYRAGRVQMRRLGDLAGALASWREARRRFPAGLLRQEVDLSILDCLVRSGRRVEAAEEASAFLRRWPSSERRSEVEAILERIGGE